VCWRLCWGRGSSGIGSAAWRRGVVLLAPIPLCFEGELLIESSYVFLICLGLLLLLHAAGAAGWKAGLLWVLGGALTVLTAQARPNIIVHGGVPALCGLAWWRSRTRAAIGDWRLAIGDVWSRRRAALLPLLGCSAGWEWPFRGVLSIRCNQTISKSYRLRAA